MGAMWQDLRTSGLIWEHLFHVPAAGGGVWMASKNTPKKKQSFEKQYEAYDIDCISVWINKWNSTRGSFTRDFLCQSNNRLINGSSKNLFVYRPTFSWGEPWFWCVSFPTLKLGICDVWQNQLKTVGFVPVFSSSFFSLFCLRIEPAPSKCESKEARNSIEMLIFRWPLPFWLARAFRLPRFWLQNCFLLFFELNIPSCFRRGIHF